MKKKILILNTGGTLSSVMKDNGFAPGLTTMDMQKDLRMVSGDIDLEMEDFMAVDSANIFPERIAEIRGKYTGIVVIHGTDTMAYTASMLSFMLQNIEIPVVLTGSQLSIADPIADALENCRCAIHMAATGCPGVFVAFNRKVMLGCRASKVRSLSFDAFDSISLGMQVDRTAIPERKGIISLENQYSDRVYSLRMFPGIHREVLYYLRDKGYKGLYIEAYGMGGMPFVKHDFIAAIGDLIASGMTVLVGTQCRYEGSNLTVYETGLKAIESGALQARDMTTEAAITKLMWVLGKTSDPAEIRPLDVFQKSRQHIHWLEVKILLPIDVLLGKEVHGPANGVICLLEFQN